MSWKDSLRDFIEDIAPVAITVPLIIGLLFVFVVVVWTIGLVWWILISAGLLFLLDLAGFWEFNLLHAVILGLVIKILRSIFTVNVSSSSGSSD